jgi:hypothetical protein
MHSEPHSLGTWGSHRLTYVYVFYISPMCLPEESGQVVVKYLHTKYLKSFLNSFLEILSKLSPITHQQTLNYCNDLCLHFFILPSALLLFLPVQLVFLCSL